jgi:hypothetical protein
MVYYNRLGWNLLSFWVLVNALSGALSSAIVKTPWGAFGLFVVPALVTATMQWLVLRRLVVHAGWWFLASLLGCGIALPAFAAVFGMGVGQWGEESSLTLVMSCLAFGTVSGIPQWLFLRGQVAHTGWWLLASIAGLSPAVLAFVVMTRGFDVGVPGAAAAGALGGVWYGSITGVVLLWLLRRHVPEAI